MRRSAGRRAGLARRAEAVATERAEVMELLGLGPYDRKLIRELSTGTRRIVDLGCLLVQRPAVILFDEPSSGIAQREAEALGRCCSRSASGRAPRCSSSSTTCRCCSASPSGCTRSRPDGSSRWATPRWRRPPSRGRAVLSGRRPRGDQPVGRARHAASGLRGKGADGHRLLGLAVGMANALLAAGIVTGLHVEPRHQSRARRAGRVRGGDDAGAQQPRAPQLLVGAAA